MVHPVKNSAAGMVAPVPAVLYRTRERLGRLPQRAVGYRSVQSVFSLGARSVIEDFSTVNNAVGAVRIGDRSRIGLGNTIIGPVPYRRRRQSGPKELPCRG